MAIGITRLAVLRVADNSGAKYARCIGLLRNKKVGSVGDRIVTSIHDNYPGGKVKRSEIHHAVIIRGKGEVQRKDGSWMRTGDTACVLINHQGDPIGTRVKGVVSATLRTGPYLKILSLSRYII